MSQVRKIMCATCPFRPGSPYAALAGYLSERSLQEARVCHSTGTSAIYGKTGKPERICRGSRDIQLGVMAWMGVIEAPTDEAWDKAWNEISERKQK